MFHRILVPLDGSETAEKVLPVVIGEGQSHQSTIALLRVIPPLRATLIMPPKFLEQTMQQATEIAEEYLDRTAERLRAEGLQVETHVQKGPPAQTILAFAQETECDLIVIGSHGEAGASQWRFGSVSNKVIKTHTTMPVLVVST